MPGVEEQENGEKASKAAYLMVKVTINTIVFTLILSILAILISDMISIAITINTVVFVIITSTIISVIITATSTYQGSIGEDLSSREEFTTALRYMFNMKSLMSFDC